MENIIIGVDVSKKTLDVAVLPTSQEMSVHKSVLKDIRETIAWLEKRLAEIDNDLGKIMRQNKAWKEKIDILISCKGIGTVVSATLLCSLPELGALNRREIRPLSGSAHSIETAAKCAAKEPYLAEGLM